MSNPPAPPVCAPRTKRPPAVSSSPSDHLSNQSQATTSHHSNSSPASSSCTSRKVRSTHPWMTILHPGPWTMLPPAPSPSIPPGSSSLLAKNKGWFKARVPPPNPFAEADKDANHTAGQRASKQSATQTEPTSPSRNDSSPPEEKSEVQDKPSSRVNPNAASVSGANRKASPFDEPAPSETPPCEDPPPPSAQTDGAAVSSSRLSERNQDMAPTSKDSSSAPGSGSLTKEGSPSGPVEGAPDTAGQATSMELSHISGLGSLSGGDHLIGRAEGGNPPGSLEVIGVPDLAESGSLVTTAASVVPPDSASSVGPGRSADVGRRPGGPGVPGVGESPAVCGSVESGAAPGLSPIPKSFSVPAIFHALKKGMTNLSQSETSGGDQEPVLKATVPKSHSMRPLCRRPAAPGYGFPLIKRTVRTDACVPADDLKGELAEVNKRLEELELCSVQLESNLRDCKNILYIDAVSQSDEERAGSIDERHNALFRSIFFNTEYKEKEEEAMMVDWMALIQEKQTLLRQEAEITHLAKQKTLEERQADLEYKLRCLLIKPESEWSAEDEAQEQKMLEDLVAVIEQRNQIISSLDEERQREKEEDAVLKAMQDKEFQKKGLKELKKSKGKFQSMKVFRMLSANAAQESTRESKDKTN